MKPPLRIAVLWVLSVGLVTTIDAQSSTGEFARRQYENGLSLMQSQVYVEALKDFQAVIDSFPKSSVADNALMQIATYRLEVAHDIAAAQAATDRLLKEYPETDSAPMAHVMTGRIRIAGGHAPADVDAALASFERVARLFPNDDAVPEAAFRAGDTLRRVRRNDEALERFRRVAMEYPRSIWTARATLAASTCLVESNNPLRALDDLQRIRRQFPGSPEAAEALNYNSIIYRLYVRPPAQPAYAFANRFVGGADAKFKDVFGIAIDDRGRVLLGHRQGVAIFDAKGTLVRNVAAQEPTALFVDEGGRLVFARGDALVSETAVTTTIAAPASDGKIRQVEEIHAAVAMSNGDRLIADRKGKSVIRVSAAGKYLGNFHTVNTDRLALNRLNDVAIIDRDTKGIAVADRDGRLLTRISAKGPGYELINPIDLTFDPLGHLYVLDRGKASVFVFSSKYRLIATIAIPEKAAGAFQRAQAFALDAAGRLYIFDDRAQRTQVYQ